MSIEAISKTPIGFKGADPGPRNQIVKRDQHVSYMLDTEDFGKILLYVSQCQLLGTKHL